MGCVEGLVKKLDCSVAGDGWYGEESGFGRYAWAIYVDSVVFVLSEVYGVAGVGVLCPGDCGVVGHCHDAYAYPVVGGGVGGHPYGVKVVLFGVDGEPCQFPAFKVSVGVEVHPDFDQLCGVGVTGSDVDLVFSALVDGVYGLGCAGGVYVSFCC